MKKIFAIITFFVLATAIYAFAFQKTALPTEDNVISTTTSTNDEPLKWYTWEEAVEANKTVKKKILVDVYTDWCGWCKVMDKKTFSDRKIAAYLKEHFYTVKFNAEQKEKISFNNHDFEYMPNAGKRGIHTLAYSLLEGKMSYPSIVYLNEKFERIAISPGYKTPEQILPDLKFAAEEQYLQQQN